MSSRRPRSAASATRPETPREPRTVCTNPSQNETPRQFGFGGRLKLLETSTMLWSLGQTVVGPGSLNIYSDTLPARPLAPAKCLPARRSTPAPEPSPTLSPTDPVPAGPRTRHLARKLGILDGQNTPGPHTPPPFPSSGCDHLIPQSCACQHWSRTGEEELLLHAPQSTGHMH